MGVRRAWTHVWVAMGFIGRGGGSWRQLDLGATDCSPRNAARGHVRGGAESIARSAGGYDASAIAAERHSCTAGLDVELCRAHGGLARSEEHTSELQSPCNLVCRLLLEKKKITNLSVRSSYVSSRLY